MIYPHTTLTLTLTTSHPLTPSLFQQESVLLAGDSMDGRQIQWTGRKKAALYQQYSYGILLVQLCSTAGATMLHLWCQNVLLFWHCQNFWYSYAGLLVFLCWTVGIAMLNLWYTYAEPLVPECFTLLVPFFQFVYKQYQGELRVLSSFYYSKTYPWGYEGGVRVKKEKNFFL